MSDDPDLVEPPALVSGAVGVGSCNRLLTGIGRVTVAISASATESLTLGFSCPDAIPGGTDISVARSFSVALYSSLSWSPGGEDLGDTVPLPDDQFQSMDGQLACADNFHVRFQPDRAMGELAFSLTSAESGGENCSGYEDAEITQSFPGRLTVDIVGSHDGVSGSWRIRVLWAVDADSGSYVDHPGFNQYSPFADDVTIEIPLTDPADDPVASLVGVHELTSTRTGAFLLFGGHTLGAAPMDISVTVTIEAA